MTFCCVTAALKSGVGRRQLDDFDRDRSIEPVDRVVHCQGPATYLRAEGHGLRRRLEAILPRGRGPRVTKKHAFRHSQPFLPEAAKRHPLGLFAYFSRRATKHRSSAFVTKSLETACNDECTYIFSWSWNDISPDRRRLQRWSHVCKNGDGTHGGDIQSRRSGPVAACARHSPGLG